MKKIKSFLNKTKKHLKDKKNWQPIAGLLIVILFVAASTAFGKFYRTRGPEKGFSYNYGYGYGYGEGYGYGYGYYQGKGSAEYGFFGSDGKATGVGVVAKTENSLTISYTTTYTAKNRIEYGTTTSSLGFYNPSSNWSAISYESSGTHSLTLIGLAPSTTYYYKVATQDAGGTVWYSTATYETVTTTAVGAITVTSSGVSTSTPVTVAGVTTTVSGMFSSIGTTITTSSMSLSPTVSSTISVTGLSGPVTINIPAGTTIYAATSSFTSIPAPTVDTAYTSTSTLAVGSTNYNPIGKIIEFGIPGVSLIFNKLVTVTIPDVTQTPAKVLYSVDGNTWHEIDYCSSTDISVTTPSPTFPRACFGYNTSTDVITLKTYHFTKFGGAGLEISAPTVTTGSASPISRTSATLNGNITATGGEDATTVGFEYGTSASSYGSTVSETGSFSTGSFSLSISSGLDCGTTYHFRAFATNSGGKGYGSDKTFTTDACAGGGGGGTAGDTSVPAISNIRVLVGDTFATISWTTNESSLTWILYGTSTAYGLEKKTTSYVTSHSLTLSDLSPLTTYHYQLKSKDSAGNIGSYTDQTFTTLALGEKPREITPPTTKPISEMTVEELKAKIVEIQQSLIKILQQLIAKLQAQLAKVKIVGIPADFTFQKNLKFGMSDEDVVYLKIVLENQGCLSGLKNTKWFGPKTKEGVKCFCQKYKDEISQFAGYQVKCTGFVGKGVRAELNQLLGR